MTISLHLTIFDYKKIVMIPSKGINYRPNIKPLTGKETYTAAHDSRQPISTHFIGSSNNM